MDSNCTVAVATTFPLYRVIWKIGVSVRQTAGSGMIILEPLMNSALNLFVFINWTLNEHGLSGDLALRRGSLHLMKIKGIYAVQNR